MFTVVAKVLSLVVPVNTRGHWPTLLAFLRVFHVIPEVETHRSPIRYVSLKMCSSGIPSPMDRAMYRTCPPNFQCQTPSLQGWAWVLPACTTALSKAHYRAQSVDWLLRALIIGY